jgi:hypothetical protein
MQQVGVSKEYNIFELQKAILQKNSLNVAKIVNYFESNTKKNPVIPRSLICIRFSARFCWHRRLQIKVRRA